MISTWHGAEWAILAIAIPTQMLRGDSALPDLRGGPDPPEPEPVVHRLVVSPGQSDYLLDDVFLIPGSLHVLRGGIYLREGSEYEAGYPEGSLRLLYDPQSPETLLVDFRCYPLAIPSTYRSSVLIRERQTPDGRAVAELSSGLPSGDASDRPQSRSSLLSVSGAKGLSVEKGNRGEVSLDQSLDLSVDGRLAGGTLVALQLSDQSIPVSGGGTSLELRELDQVSFRVVNGNASATLGDYPYALSGFEFARLERKLEGVHGEWKAGGYSFSGVGAMRPGKFATVRLDGIEGKQGPYLLGTGNGAAGAGAMILANTERVYLDGELMKRGERNDYAIDYNSGAVTFTSRRLIHGDSRIEVDYEYDENGRRGSFYGTTFDSRNGGDRNGVGGYYLREMEAIEPDTLGGIESGGTADDRMGLAGIYGTVVGLRVEGEGAYQSRRSSGLSPGGGQGPSGAYWFRGGLKEVSLFDREKGADRWGISWSEKRVEDGFRYPGRRHEPDFHWRWGLLPEETGPEAWRVFDLDLDLREDAGLEMEWGKVVRDRGEYAHRRKVSGSLAQGRWRPALGGERYWIHAMRSGGEGGEGGSLRPVRISGHSASISRQWFGWTPSFGYAFREELGWDEVGRGMSYDEFTPSVEGTLAGGIKTGARFLWRADRIREGEGGTWQDASRLFQGRAEAEYEGASGLTMQGSTEYRRRRYLQGSSGRITSIIGRGEVLASGWDRTYSTNTVYELSSMSNVIQEAIFVPERAEEGDFLADGTYVGPGSGTHVRQTVSEAESEGRVIGASLMSIQNLDFNDWIKEREWPLASLSHSATIELKTERLGDDRWRVYLFMPVGSENGGTELYRSLQYRGDVEGVWGEGREWTTLLVFEYFNRLDRRYTNLAQDFTQRETRLVLGGSLESGFDLEMNLALRRRGDSFPVDLRERRVESEVGYRTGNRVRYFVEADVGSSRDRISGARLRDGSFGPGLEVYFEGGGNLDLQWRVERVLNEVPGTTPPLLMLAGRDVGTTQRYQVRSNWRIRGSLELTASVTGRKRPGVEVFEHTGRTDFTYRF